MMRAIHFCKYYRLKNNYLSSKPIEYFLSRSGGLVWFDGSQGTFQEYVKLE